jgi:hypothetical protein
MTRPAWIDSHAKSVVRVGSGVKLLISYTVVLYLLMLCGCQGCTPWARKSLTPEELEAKRREQQDALLANDLVALPTDSQRALVTVKPGHWLETSQRFKSTREDLQVIAVGSVYRGNERLQLPATTFQTEFTRKTVLPKGQEKTLGLQFFVPAAFKPTSDSIPEESLRARLAFSTELMAVPLMSPIAGSSKRSAVNELKEHEFQLAVVSPQALGYQYLSSLDAVLWPRLDQFSDFTLRSYDVSLVEPKDGFYALPHSFLTMTAVAAIVWDDVDCSALSIDQQKALVDWIHWGGQLVISGPASWSRLYDSFLSPLLPVNRAESIELRTEDFGELSDSWITQDLGQYSHASPLEIIGAPVAGLRWQLSERGTWMPGTGELVAESFVGRGRIVVAGFPLREPRIINWPYFSSFFSTGLLRRWPRIVERSEPAKDLRVNWMAPYRSDNMDPRMHSNLRILSRDLPKSTRPVFQKISSLGQPEASMANSLAGELEVPTNQEVWQAMPEVNVFSDGDGFVGGGDVQKNQSGDYEPMSWGGAAAWSDFQGLGDDAIDALRAAAGIELPSRSTIVRLIAGYLICLVPLNYLLFRMLRRLEYAWLAAPLMALIGVVVVTRVAQLDIGFARRATDIGILELHEGHSRGHLTQYFALYTSLSTNYSIELPEFDSVALPMADMRREQRRGQSAARVLRTNYGRSEGVVLEPLTVYSNSTEMVHAEQMVQLDGPVRWKESEDGADQLMNSRQFALDSVLLLRRTASGQLQYAWFERLEAGQRATVVWRPGSLSTACEPWNKRLNTQLSKPTTGELKQMRGMWLGGLLDRLAQKTPIQPGAAVLIGLTDQHMGALKLSPAQDQVDSSCIVVAHLSRPVVGPAVPDQSIYSRALKDDLDEDYEPGVD